MIIPHFLIIKLSVFNFFRKEDYTYYPQYLPTHTNTVHHRIRPILIFITDYTKRMAISFINSHLIKPLSLSSHNFNFREWENKFTPIFNKLMLPF